VLQALALAGGPTEFASTSSIVVIRPAAGGTEQRFRVNYRALVTGRARPIMLASGDTVFVP
jgi:polysaccharide export outer membrane protein